MIACGVAGTGALGQASATPDAAPSRGVPPPPFPHPLITEVLYAVPRDGGDASGDGTRNATGDEFIELVNPHEKAIDLGGYVLSDRNPAGKGRMEFTFPPLRLRPGEVAVVFNGYQSGWTGPVGTAQRAPAGGNERFDGAFVFTMEVDSPRTALSNGGDWVLLSDPRGRAVHLIRWGEFEEKPPRALIVEEIEERAGGSVARTSEGGSLSDHASLSGLPYSPGRFPPPGSP